MVTVGATREVGSRKRGHFMAPAHIRIRLQKPVPVLIIEINIKPWFGVI